MLPNNRYLFLILCLVFLGSCKKDEIVIYPIVIDKDIHSEVYELSLADSNIVDLRINAIQEDYITSTSFLISIEILNPYWKIVSEEKIHYTCTELGTGSDYDQIYSCDSSSDSSFYEVVKLYQDSELANLNTANTFLNDPTTLVHSNYFHVGGGPYNPSTSFTKSCFTEHTSGKIIFQNDDGERLTLGIGKYSTFPVYFLIEIDKL